MFCNIFHCDSHLFSLPNFGQILKSQKLKIKNSIRSVDGVFHYSELTTNLRRLLLEELLEVRQ